MYSIIIKLKFFRDTDILLVFFFPFPIDVFKNFESKGKFFSFVGQTSQTVTEMYNLFRASQLIFPEEKILNDAKKFTSNFLQEKQAQNQLLDKWIITKDLPGEVKIMLEGHLLILETFSYVTS